MTDLSDGIDRSSHFQGMLRVAGHVFSRSSSVSGLQLVLGDGQRVALEDIRASPGLVRAFGGRQCLADPRMLAFWRDDKPRDPRPHVIYQGEIGLTRAFKRCGCTIDVVYGAHRLSARLQQMALYEAVDAMRFMHYGFRRHVLMPSITQAIDARGLFNDGAAEAADGAGAYSVADAVRTPSLTRLQSLKQANGRVTSIRPSVPQEAPSALTGAIAATRLVKQLLIDQIMDHVTSGSQLHFGFGLFHRLLGCPVSSAISVCARDLSRTRLRRDPGQRARARSPAPAARVDQPRPLRHARRRAFVALSLRPSVTLSGCSSPSRACRRPAHTGWSRTPA
jgi:hypothetical protein